MIFVGIDVAKRKHDCCIISSDGEILRDSFTFPNSREGFKSLHRAITDSLKEAGGDKIKAGLESTGQYSRNLTEFLLSKRLNPVLLNPLASDSFRKARTLRKTKTDKTDARLIASMLFAEDTKPYVKTSYHIDALKSLSRARFRLVRERAKLKTSLVRLLDTLFPELDGAVYSLHQKSTLAMLSAFPSAKAVANAHLTRLTNILAENSRGRYGKDKAIEIRELAKNSIASGNDAQSFELLSVIRHIAFVQSEIGILDGQIKGVMDELGSPLMSVPGISYTLAAMILAEIGDVNMFAMPAKLLAFAGLEPSTCQSGNYTASHARMVKRGSKYLRWALL
jgi:transposase